jgi:hypothetical protein
LVVWSATDFSSATAGAALGLATGFLAAGAFFVGAALAAVFSVAGAFVTAAAFFGAGFFAVVAFAAGFFVSVFGLAALGATGAAGFLSPAFLSFTGPDAPFGCSKTPLSTPDFRALDTCAVKALSVVFPSLLLALIYFLIA